MESYRKLCLQQQTELRRILTPEQFEEVLPVLLSQHARLHSARMAQTETWSFEDWVMDDLEAEQARRIPPVSEHSVAWNIWHIARIEDIAMNILVGGSPQIFHQDNWLAKLNITVQHSGNAMAQAEVADLSARIDLEALRAYRSAVGRRTREIIQGLRPQDLKKKVDPARLQQVMDQGALVEAAREIADYWSRRDIAGLLLMPATRHNLVHLNESLNIKRKL